MSDLRKAAEQALEALIWHDETVRTRADSAAIIELRAALAQPEYPLPESLYPDSKDWVASDYAGRVEWLHFMYESKQREVEQWETAMPEPEQEPVAYQWLRSSVIRKRIPKTAEISAWVPLYAHPPQRKPLTEKEIYKTFGWYAIPFVRAVEKAHGIGND